MVDMLIENHAFCSINASAVVLSRVLLVWGLKGCSGNGSQQKFSWLFLWASVFRAACFILLHAGRCVCVCAAEGTLLVIRNSRAEFSPASVWNANPHCRKASFSLTKGW